MATAPVIESPLSSDVLQKRFKKIRAQTSPACIPHVVKDYGQGPANHPINRDGYCIIPAIYPQNDTFKAMSEWSFESAWGAPIKKAKAKSRKASSKVITMEATESAPDSAASSRSCSVSDCSDEWIWTIHFLLDEDAKHDSTGNKSETDLSDFDEDLFENLRCSSGTSSSADSRKRTRSSESLI